MRSWIAIAAAFAASACAFEPQAVVITPKVEAADSRIGANRPINLNVVDERPRSTLGTRGVKGVGADLTISGDLAAIVRDSLIDGLTRQNFRPLVGQNPESRELRVEIRNLDYTVTQGFWTGSLRVDTSLKTICIRGVQRPYEFLHRGENADDVMVVQTAESNNVYISKAVSAAIASVLKDQALLTCLSN